jgi:hypothetical protein
MSLEERRGRGKPSHEEKRKKRRATKRRGRKDRRKTLEKNVLYIEKSTRIDFLIALRN